MSIFPKSVQQNSLGQPSTEEPFISWSTLEKAINRYVVPRKDGKDVYGSLQSSNILLRYFECENCYGLQQDCSGKILCGDKAFVTSADPRICVLPGQSTNSAVRFDKQQVADCVVEEEGSKYIKLDNILINVGFLMNQLRDILKSENPSLADFLAGVLSKVSDACGGLWALELVDASADTNTDTSPKLAIIDTSVYEPNKDSVFQVPALPTNSVIREIKLDMKMTESMKTQALYSNANRLPFSAKSNSGGGCSSNTIKGFRLYGKDVIDNLALPAQKQESNDCQKCKECNKPGEKKEPPTFMELIKQHGNDLTSGPIESLKSALVSAYSSAASFGRDTHCDGVILPFDFGFTLDGIGGFMFGQMVSSDRIPKQIRDAFNFQITVVEHAITPNDWSTTITSVARYKSTKETSKVDCIAKQAASNTTNPIDAYKINEDGIIVGRETGGGI